MKQSQTQKKLTFLALFCLVVSIAIFAAWIYAFNIGSTQAERVEIWMGYFPDFLQHPAAPLLIGLAFSGFAMIFNIICLVIQSTLFWRVLNIIILVFSSLLLLFNLFGLL